MSCQDGGFVQQRLPTLLDATITFAHRGAKAHAPENTVAAFRLALEMGASGLESPRIPSASSAEDATTVPESTMRVMARNPQRMAMAVRTMVFMG